MDSYQTNLAPRFSQLLIQREAELRGMLQASSALPGEYVEAEAHEVLDFKDMASEQSLATVADAKTEQAALELQQVLAAQRRLQDHSYGVCLDCGEAMDLRRLSALPAAALCTACQAIAEHGRPVPARR